MILFRVLLMALNVGMVTYLIYHMFQTFQQREEPSRKRLVMIGGVLLLIVPVAMLMRFIPPSPLYFLVYPVAVFVFIYLTRGRLV